MRDRGQRVAFDNFRKFLAKQTKFMEYIHSHNFFRLSKKDRSRLIKKIADFDTFFTSEHNFGVVVFKNKLWTWEIQVNGGIFMEVYHL